jgi:hypothetical protein
MFHLDIRPSNVIILPNGQVTLIDFAKSKKNTFRVGSPEWTQMITKEREKANEEFEFRLAEVQALRLFEIGDKASKVHSALTPSPDVPQRYIDLLVAREDYKRADQFYKLSQDRGFNVEYAHSLTTGRSGEAPISFAVELSSDRTSSKSP